MNAPIFRLFALFAVMFAVLVGFSSRWAVFGAQRLRENPKNSRVVLEEQRIKRGVIRAADGTVLAGSASLSGDRYTRRYPTGKLFAQASVSGRDQNQIKRARSVTVAQVTDLRGSQPTLRRVRFSTPALACRSEWLSVFSSEI